MEPRKLTGVEELDWAATVVHSQPLCYSAGALASADRPGFVRSGSGIAWYGGRLAIVQDDANFIALTDPVSGNVESLELPAGHAGKRQFDDLRGNKKWKLDLESCCSFRTPQGSEVWLGFGSGSSPLRESIVLMESAEELDPAVRIVRASRFYAALRHEVGFSGSELNLEGVALVSPGTLQLFQRGNGAPVGGLLPTDSSCEVDLSDFLNYLENPEERPVPELRNVRRYDIGKISGIRLTFTDAVEHEGRVFFLAAAEDSPDTLRDGPVVGVALGVLDARGIPRWSLVRNVDGRPFLGKAEGIAFDPSESGMAYIVVDTDNPKIPSQLCRVRISGFQH